MHPDADHFAVFELMVEDSRVSTPIKALVYI